MAAPAVTGPGHGEMTELDGLQLKCNQVMMMMMMMIMMMIMMMVMMIMMMMISDDG